MGSVKIQTGAGQVGEQAQANYSKPLYLVTMLFFMWGFITCMNDILIPHLQEVFTLQNWQAMLVQTAFFGAYFIVSLGYYLWSVWKVDPISQIGYKNGIILGLVVSAIGCLLFYPAATVESYGFFLLALFVLAAGVTILQIAANPYVTILGKPEGASSRLNMTQAFNSLGTTVAPLIGGYLVFGAIGEESLGAAAVRLPYIGLAVVLVLIAVVFKSFPLPEIKAPQSIHTDNNLLRNRHLLFGIIAIFAYVGGEVAIGSNLINFAKLPHIAGLDETQASHYLALFWGGAMVGRFFGAIALADFGKLSNRLASIVGIAVVAGLVVWFTFGGQVALYAISFILLNVAVLLVGRFIPQKTLWTFGLSVILLLMVGMLTEGYLALWAIVAVGLFNSIMFPTIFSLAITGLGKSTAQAASLLVMAIVGGAVVTPLQGLVADLFDNIQFSFIVPLFCYVFVVFYGVDGYKIRG